MLTLSVPFLLKASSCPEPRTTCNQTVLRRTSLRADVLWMQSSLTHPSWNSFYFYSVIFNHLQLQRHTHIPSLISCECLFPRSFCVKHLVTTTIFIRVQLPRNLLILCTYRIQYLLSSLQTQQCSEIVIFRLLIASKCCLHCAKAALYLTYVARRGYFRPFYLLFRMSVLEIPIIYSLHVSE